jgi:hypothetical protein
MELSGRPTGEAMHRHAAPRRVLEHGPLREARPPSEAIAEEALNLGATLSVLDRALAAIHHDADDLEAGVQVRPYELRG